MTDKIINSVEEFITTTRVDSSPWLTVQPKWFRGEPESTKALLPRLYREGLSDRENALLQLFRARAPAYYERVPERKQTDQWLFLAQHAGLPTRLLDWSESSLLGLYFALKEKEKPAIVWMLNPLHLNHEANGRPEDINPDDLLEFPLPWFRPEPPRRNPANENIRGAWEKDGPGVALPVAVYPTYVHPRLHGQRSCFTVHGKRKEGLDKMVSGPLLKRYVINQNFRQEMLADLRVLGVTQTVAFPDLDGLATELRMRFS